MTLSDTPKAFDEGHIAVTTLGHLVETIGSPMLHVLAAPRGMEQRVRGTVLHDPTDPLPDGPDALLLMSGIRADESAATELVREAASRGYCAVAIKRRGRDASALVNEASTGGVTVLAVADDIPWRSLDALLLSVLGSRGVGGESAGGGGSDELFALANAIAASTGGSVAIEDMDRRVLAYSSMPNQRIDALRQQGILERRVPEMDRNLAQYRAVLGATGIVRFPGAEDELPRAAIAIRAGTQPLGTIWAIESVGGIDADGTRALLDGARLAALHILRGRNAAELDLLVRESALRGALDGSWTAPEAAFRLSLPAGVELALVGFAALPDPVGAAPLITHVGSALARYVAAFRPDASVATTARSVYLLLPGGGPEAAARLTKGALAAIRKTFADRVRAAIAFTSTDPKELPTMRREIDDILRVTVAQLDLPPVAVLGDVHTRVLLAHVADELGREPRLRHPGVEAMVVYDVEHRTDYADSVTAWLDAVGDIVAAAAKMGVHPNTLRYRLRRSGELFGLELDKPDDRLSIWLQLRLAAP
jgi:hypothetical protein